MIGIDRSLAINLKPRTVVELLRLRVQDGPERAAYRFLSDGETEQERITYGELDARARRIAAVLKSAGASGQRALLLYPPGLDYVAAFFGCLYAGVVAVPAYPPRANRNLQRLQAIASDAQAAHALTTKSILTRVELAPAQKAGLEHLRWLATDDDALDSGSQLVEPEQFDAEALAYLQYTSGSTSLPKGVMISHGNVLHNSAYIHQGFGHTPESVSLSWLPHFHDMGLLDGIIQPLYGGFTGILMSPAAFLQRPLRWLEAVGRYRVTHTGGPNFAYDLCARRVGEEARAALDLSSWRVAYNGAEPVRAETLERFAETFAPCGFRWEAFYPAYGLAEATLKVSGGQAGGAPVLCTLRGNALEENRVVAAAGDEEGARTLVGSGTTALGTEVRVVRPESLSECQPGEVGEIWVKGPGVAAGYWNRPEESERTFRAYLGATEEGPFLRTGDLGFVKDGELFVTGRLKDLIIIRGRNHYPQDIEAAVESSHAALRRGSGVAFSVEMGGAERLIVAQEVEARQQVEWQEVIGRIREAIAEEFEVQPAAVLLLKPGAVPKTSSGKLQRNASRIKFLGNDWDMVAEWRAPTGDEAPERAPFESTPAQIESLDALSLENWLRTKLAAMLGVSACEIDVSVPLARYGVDSVASIELMHAVETGLGVRLPLAEFLQSPSLVELAARAAAQLQKAGDEKPDAHAPHPPQIEAEHAGENWHPLSHNQKSLWFLRQIAPESAAYNLSFAARIRGSLDAEALRRAFQTLTERHASLRTSFGAVMGESAQRVHASAVLSFQTEDARSLSEASLRERMSLEAHRPFDLEQAPLLRIFLFERAEQEHVLMLVAHHIVVDFWSLSILMRELGALYEEDSNGARAILDAPGPPYTNYVDWQRELLESAEGEALRNYWQRELAGELPVLDLPTDYPRPAVQSHRGASLPLRLDAGLTSRLKSLARASDATLYTVLLAAFEVLLYRHTGQREVLVGSPTSGRSLAEVSNSVGYFVNPVVLRARLSGSTGFDELLAETRRTALAAFAHQDYPFDLLVKALQPERDPARSPLFQTMFALHRAHGQAGEALAAFALGEEGAQVRLGGLSLESVALEQRIAQFDLSLTVAEVDEELAASFEYCTDLFEPSTVERMAGHFRVLLEAIAADSSKRLDELPLLTATEREQLLFEWNGGERQSRHEQFVHQLFERHAAESPGHAAVVHEGAELTYAQLNARANQLARHLRARGVGPNVLVALCVERSFEMLVGLLGILKAGGAYVPLDPAYPRERLAFMLRDSGAPLVLTQRKFSDELAATGGAGLIRLDADWATIARESDANTRVEIHADNLAYVIYTSGSTGVPKGVMIGHGSLTNYIEAVTGEYGATPDDRFLQFASLSFDISVEEIFSCLTHGATLVLRGDEMTASTVALLRECRERKITVLNLPTAYWHQLSANLTADDWAREAGAVRLVVTGGEKIRPERLSEWHSAVGERARLVDIYGPTEATVGATICDLTGAGGAENSSRRITIGRPVRNTQAYVLDARLEPVPVGVAGELHLGGAGLALGYLNCPEATAGKFIPNPFSRTTGARLYKTGDLARFLPDGTLEFLGRLDDQVKVRGFRIELGEIERALVRHARVGDAAVLLRDDDGEKRLVAYVVADASGASDAADAADAADGVEAPDAGELRRYLKESLPDYMLPSAFVMLSELPLTPNGKVDRRALPAPGPSRPRLASAFVAPQSEVEKSLAAIWADVLKLERVGTGDNFFELGGDSILAIQVIARAQSDGVRLTASQMFKHPTVAELAAVADTATPARREAEQDAVSGEVPLTPIQRWFFAQGFEAADHWNMALLLEVREELRPELLERALSHLAVHHDALRLRFAREGAGWRQFVAEPETDCGILRRVDLSGTAEEARRAAIETVAAETQGQLSLTKGPLWRAVLFDLGGGSAPRLLLVAHHLVVDAVSWGILLEDLSRACRQLGRGERPELPSKTTSFKSWAERLESYARSAAMREKLVYWTRLATKEFPKSLPVDYPGGANREASTRTFSVALDAEETRSLLRDVPPVYHTQINDVLLAALAAAFARWTGERALLLELEGHGREELFADADLSRTVGWFTSAFPVLLETDETLAHGEALKRVKEQLRAIPDSGVGYGLLRYLSDAPEVSAVLRALPRPQVSFNYLGQLDYMLESDSLFGPGRESTGPTRDGRNQRTHLLEINAGVRGGQLRLDWSYSSGLYEAATVEALAARYLESLRGIIGHCLSPEAGGRTPSDFPLATLDARRLDELIKSTGPAADLYPLSPMQLGMLFHSLYAPQTGVYIEQLSCALEGDLNAAAFERAWQRVAERHTILRTSFVWENLDEPLQVVHRSVALKVEQYDWRELSPEEQERRLESLLDEDRRRGFELSRAPLMRLALARLGENSHRFIWTHHHLLLDGWSVALLLREVLDAYEAFCAGEDSPRRSARPFRDYVAWLRQQDKAKAEQFWRAELKGFAEPTPLTAGRPESGAEGEAGRVPKQETRLTKDETASLQAFARQHQLTPSTLVQGAFAILLGRYSGRDDVVFGTTVAGRPPSLAGVDTAAGLFINTLPARVRIASKETAVAWLKGLQAKLVNLRDYEYSSLADVQGWSDVPRGQALFDALLVFENYPVDAALVGPGAHLSLGDVRSVERTNYPLTIAALPGAELVLQALYTNERFGAAGIESLLGHLKNLLLDIAAHPHRSLADLQLLGEDERRRILVEWNDTSVAYERERTIQQLFEEQAASRPEAAAVVFADEQLSYGELNRRANRVAHHLRRLGVGAETPVALSVERSIEMVVGLVGILKAGGCYVPLDPAHPKDRLAFMIEDAGAPVLLTQERLRDLFPTEGARVVCLDADWEVIGAEAVHNPEPSAAGDNVAYIIYTSGSTGRPKGVGVSHSSVLNLVNWYGRTLGLRPTDRATQLAGIGFDASVMEVWCNLLAGASLYLADEETRLSVAKLRDWLVANRIDLSFAPTPLAELLLELEWPADTALRVLCTGGDKLHRFPPASVGFKVLNIYGPTENTVMATTAMFSPGEGSPEQSPPIGRPIDNVDVYVLDERMRPLPAGVAGELYIGGLNLARGYWRRPALTAERFIPNPHSTEPGARLYRTGDLVRHLPDGTLEFLERIDNQVKIRGFRIELGEIETVLAAHETVGAAVVMAREDVPGDKRLVAYVMPDAEEQAPELGELRRYLRERLPEYMIPAAFVVLDSLPLTPNGKVDRRALPAPNAAQQSSAETFVAPRNPLEEALADIWRGVLGVERIGVHDNFFKLGGHSLMATRVLSNVRRIFRLELPLSVVFEAGTIAELALAVVPFETQPGQTEKIARVLQKLKGISAEDARRELQRKRRERENR